MDNQLRAIKDSSYIVLPQQISRKPLRQGRLSIILVMKMMKINLSSLKAMMRYQEWSLTRTI